MHVKFAIRALLTIVAIGLIVGWSVNAVTLVSPPPPSEFRTFCKAGKRIVRWCDTKTDGAWEIPCNNSLRGNCNSVNLRNGKEVWIHVLGRDAYNNHVSSAPTIDIPASSLTSYTTDGGNCYEYPVSSTVTGAQICFEVAYAVDKDLYQPAGVWSSSTGQWVYGACMANTSCAAGVCYTPGGQNIGQSCTTSSDCAMKGCSSCYCKF